MKVLVTGSLRNIEDTDQNKASRRDEMCEAGRQLGKALAARGHTLLVGSEDPEDLDPHVVQGFLESQKASRVEVHLIKGAKPCYVGQAAVENVYHRYQDWDVTVLDMVRENTGGVIVVGGRAGVITTGIASWMLGRPTIPFAGFGGGAAKVWDYGSSDRRRFYFDSLTDAEIDQLDGPWSTNTPSSLVTLLERCAVFARRAKVSPSVRALVTVGILLSLVAWVALLAIPLLWWPDEGLAASAGAAAPLLAESTGSRFILLLGAVCSAGAFGALVQSMRAIRDGQPITAGKVAIDTVLGVAAGFLTATLYLLAQIAINGELSLPHVNKDYSRVALITSMAGVFASLYLDAAFSRFDVIKGTVMSGTFGGKSDDKGGS